ncbi:hypothetical protein OHT57_06440 [Streptomyces sp. NBC_00285]|uniref:hypothetical protein n=1 Tax=Streptomyces sp. NBC_00285 TaxID=2975700 RepID=UPI002E29EE8F|nr:hypothetical protein [Streptomyces sp. NBC_00285]
MAIEPYQQTPATPAEAEPLVNLNVITVQPQPTATVAPFSYQRLVQLDTGQWTLAYVSPAPPVIVAAAPTRTERRGLSRNERRAIGVTGSLSVLMLSAGGAIAMASPYLASVAHLAFATATLIGTGAAGWLALRVAGLTFAGSSGGGRRGEPTAPIKVTNNVTVNNGGFLARGNATGIGRIDRIG